MVLKEMGSVFLFVILITFIGDVTGYDDFLNGEERVYCYQCHSERDRDCRNIDSLSETAKSSFNIPCLDDEKYNNTKPFCRKITQTIFPRENLEIVIRKCGWVRHPRLDCYNVRNEDHVETICQCFESGCNGTPVLRLPVVLVTAASTFLLLLRHN